MILLKNAELYAPEYVGKRDLLIEGDKIVKVAESICVDADEGLVKTMDVSGKKVVPGF
ncbi:MAG TPA: beta-aspartyl-peptidase, partial [Tissierellia bacterium]|nr:beta-aspartyl-peptidase [Tissierellia bacterium]